MTSYNEREGSFFRKKENLHKATLLEQREVVVFLQLFIFYLLFYWSIICQINAVWPQPLLPK